MLEMTYPVREAHPNNVEAIVAILNPIIETGKYTVFDTPLTVESERQYILNFPSRGIFYVALHPTSQGVVGFQSMEPFADFTGAFDHVGVIGTYVDLAMRRKGVAACLFEATFNAARQKGYEKIFTYVRVDNPAALATYQKHGFSIVGTAKKHARCNGRYVDEIIIEKFL